MEIVPKNKTLDVTKHGITLGNLNCSDITYKCTISVGSSPGRTVKKELGINDALLFQTESFGLKEVRIFEIDRDEIKVKVSNVSPSNIFFGMDPESIAGDVPISEDEYEQYVSNLTKLKEDFSNNTNISKEEFSYLSAQVDYLIAFAGRAGITKKDIILQTMGLVCNFSVATIFAPDIAKEIFIGFANSIPWLIDSVVHSYSLLGSKIPPEISK
ncbi:hypothetical protein [Agarivorans albus]|uniref:Uncharacterized protein n=1 Tax=Agarivorans albus MKT 106 TaxID=1331007 RepID=R9PQG5_AGAAL|nr:hypothetical protein [Agarivorans albus]GAD03594.1 hypothetical protein AALB_3674 [Agarivorans albus MKT 106]